MEQQIELFGLYKDRYGTVIIPILLTHAAVNYLEYGADRWYTTNMSLRAFDHTPVVKAQFDLDTLLNGRLKELPDWARDKVHCVVPPFRLKEGMKVAIEQNTHLYSTVCTVVPVTHPVKGRMWYIMDKYDCLFGPYNDDGTSIASYGSVRVIEVK